jgi:hypothetical protein
MSDSKPTITAGELYRGVAPMLYDTHLSQQMFVLGQTDAGHVIVAYENADVDTTCTVDEKILRCSPDFIALCDHGYTQRDSCPGCDQVDNDIHERAETAGTHLSAHVGNGASIDLGVVVFHADCTRSAITPDGDIVVRHADGDSWKTTRRALVLEHKRNAHRLALSENEMCKTDASTAYDIETELLGDVRREQQITEAVRMLVSHGITTPAAFVALVAAVTTHDEHVSTFEAGLISAYPINFVAGGVVTGRDGNPITKAEAMRALGFIEHPRMSAAEAYAVIDFADPPLGTIVQRKRAVRGWLVDHAPVVPVEHDGSNL